MRKLYLLIITIAFLFPGCVKNKNHDALLACQEKDVELANLILEDIKNVMDEKRPEFKAINNAYYMKMRLHNNLILEKLKYVIAHHPRKIKVILAAPWYDLSEKENNLMQNDVIIKKMTDEKNLRDIEYERFTIKDEYWESRKIEGKGKEAFWKRKPELLQLMKDWKKIEDEYSKS